MRAFISGSFSAHPARDFLYNRKCNFLLYKKTTT